jgi:hypothetical protein
MEVTITPSSDWLIGPNNQRNKRKA